MTDIAIGKKIATIVAKRLSQLMAEQGTRPDDVVPSVKVVGNAWISLMAYQAKGYAYIAP